MLATGAAAALNQSDTCYVHHSLADIDTKNCSRTKSIKWVAGDFSKVLTDEQD